MLLNLGQKQENLRKQKARDRNLRLEQEVTDTFMAYIILAMPSPPTHNKLSILPYNLGRTFPQTIPSLFDAVRAEEENQTLLALPTE